MSKTNFIFLLQILIFQFQAQIIPHRHKIIIGDIGGTFVRLSLEYMSSDINFKPQIIDKTVLNSHDYDSLETLLREYLSNIKNEKPLYAIIGLPGPIIKNRILKLVNILNWPSVSGDELAEKLGLKKLIFLNDFVCSGYGIQVNLKKNKDYIQLNDVIGEKDGQKVVIGAGTGLGISFLIKGQGEKYYNVGSTEGGRQDFSPKNYRYMEINEFLKKETGANNISIGRLCSGRALIPFYKFLLKFENENNEDNDLELTKKIENFHDYDDKQTQHLINMEITVKGKNGQCKLCKKVLLLFIEIFGEVAGDVSLLTMPTGGVYLSGGVTYALQELIIENKDLFLKHFRNKDGLGYILKSFPIYLVKNPDLGLLGAKEAARRLLEIEGL